MLVFVRVNVGFVLIYKFLGKLGKKMNVRVCVVRDFGRS